MPGTFHRLLGALTSWQLIAGALLLLPAAAVVEGAPPTITTDNALGFLYLTLVGTAGALLVFGAVLVSVSRPSARRAGRAAPAAGGGRAARPPRPAAATPR